MEGAAKNTGILRVERVDSRCQANMESPKLITLEAKYRGLINTVRSMQKNLVTLIFSAKKVEVAVRIAAKNLFDQGQTVFDIGRRMDLLDRKMERRKWRCRRHYTSRIYAQPTASITSCQSSHLSSCSSSSTRDLEASVTPSQPSLNGLQFTSGTQMREDLPSRTGSPLSSSSFARYSSPSSSHVADDDLKSESCVEFSCSGCTPPRTNSAKPLLPSRLTVSCSGFVLDGLPLRTSPNNSKTSLRRTVSCLETGSTKECHASKYQCKSSEPSRPVSSKLSRKDIPNDALFSQRCHPKNKDAFIRHYYNSSLGKKLLEAGKGGKLEEVDKLLAAGADANFSTDGMWTLLHRAAARSQAHFLNVLLNAGANPDIRNCYGYTALHLAAYHDSSGKCVTQLIKAGADLEARNRTGRTPLHYAAENSNEEGIRKLLASGASVFAADNDGKTPFDVAELEHIQKLISPLQFRKRRARSRQRRQNRSPTPF